MSKEVYKKIALHSCYWLLAALAIALSLSGIRGAGVNYKAYIYILSVAAAHYLTLIFSKYIRRNFITKKHKTTPFLLLPAVLTVVMFIWIVFDNFSLYITEYMTAAVGVIFLFSLSGALFKRNALSVVNCVYMFFVIISAGFIISFRVSAAVISLEYLYIIAIIGVILGGIYFVSSLILTIFSRRALNGERLEKMFCSYLDGVFKGVEKNGETAEIREQLFGVLKARASECLEAGFCYYSAYCKALDSTEDFSALIIPHKLNPIARFSKTTNRFTFGLYVIISTVILTLTSIFAPQNFMPQNAEQFNMFPMAAAIVVSFVYFGILSVKRLLYNFEAKKYFLTPVCLWILVSIATEMGVLIAKLIRTPNMNIILIITSSVLAALGIAVVFIERKLYKK